MVSLQCHFFFFKKENINSAIRCPFYLFGDLGICAREEFQGGPVSERGEKASAARVGFPEGCGPRCVGAKV